MTFKEKLNPYLIKYPNLKQFIKFCIIGGIAAIIHFSILYSFTEWLKLWYIISNAFGFLISAAFNFISNKLWTFRNKERGLRIVNQAIKFSIVLVSGLLINTTIIYGLTEWISLDYRFSWVFATGIVTFWNFGFYRFWTFKAPQSQISDLPKN